MFFFKVILDEYANIIVEDEELKRKRHQAKLLQRRDTLMQLDPTGELALIESISSEELLIEIVCIKKFIFCFIKITLHLINIYDHIDKNINL